MAAKAKAKALEPYTETLAITPAMAEQWLERNVNNYRKLDTNRVQQYARDMANGNWGYTGDTIKFDTNTDLSDGQHRLEAIVLSKQTITMDVKWNVDPAARDYMDIGGKRSMHQILGNHGYTHTNVLQSMFRLEIDVVSIRKGMKPQGRNATFPEIMSMIEQEEDAQWAVLQVSNLPHKIMNRSAAAYCYLQFHKIHPDEAAYFFTKLLEPSNLDEDSPILRLHRRFTVGSWYVKGRMLRLQQVTACIRAWNAFREGAKSVKLSPLPAVEEELKIPEPV